LIEPRFCRNKNFEFLCKFKVEIEVKIHHLARG
jgi:hypothetical protein